MNFRLSTQAFRLSVQSCWILNLALPPTASPFGRHWILGMKHFKASACILVSTSNTRPHFVVCFSVNLYPVHVCTGSFFLMDCSPALERNLPSFLLFWMLFLVQREREREYCIRAVSDSFSLEYKEKKYFFLLLLYSPLKSLIIKMIIIITSASLLPENQL